MDKHRSECAIPTQTLGHCKRPARYAFVSDARAWNAPETVATVCAQHARGAGAARMLLPMPWEYTYVVDTATNLVVRGSRA